MIAVTGSPRTGTSLMMQTLRLLGIPISGLAFHKDFSNRELNPRGYWDLPIADTLNGVNHNTYSGQAIKLFGLQLSRTNPKYVSKVIVCSRRKESALPSIQRLIESEQWQLAALGIEPTAEACERTYDLNYDLIREYLKVNKMHSIFVTYENMIDNPTEEIKHVANFVESSMGITEAVNNVQRDAIWQQQE